ncbi:unnamed protein product [Caenorhabditis nigoni]
MADSKKKEFRISHVFNNINSVSTEKTIYGDVVKRFGVYWKIQLYKDQDGDIFPYLVGECSETSNWSMNTFCDVIVGGKAFKTGLGFEFKQDVMKLNAWYIPKKDYPDYQIGQNASIEFHVKIIAMTGIEEKQKSINFDDDAAKKSSDVVLKVGNHEFYVNKMYLSFHSTYFESLFSGNFSESEKSIIELKDIDPESFQNFLEVLYAASLVTNGTVSEILKLADFFDAKIVVRRCEEFLINLSEGTLQFKFQLAIKYKLDGLKKKCFAEMTKTTNFRDFIPENSADFDTELWKELYERTISLI